jgi:hypothetical protein
MKHLFCTHPSPPLLSPLFCELQTNTSTREHCHFHFRGEQIQVQRLSDSAKVVQVSRESHQALKAQNGRGAWAAQERAGLQVSGLLAVWSRTCRKTIFTLTSDILCFPPRHKTVVLFHT